MDRVRVDGWTLSGVYTAVRERRPLVANVHSWQGLCPPLFCTPTSLGGSTVRPETFTADRNTVCHRDRWPCSFYGQIAIPATRSATATEYKSAPKMIAHRHRTFRHPSCASCPAMVRLGRAWKAHPCKMAGLGYKSRPPQRLLLAQVSLGSSPSERG